MKSTYVGTRSDNVGDIRCSFAPASDALLTVYLLGGKQFKQGHLYLGLWKWILLEVIAHILLTV